MHDKNAIWEWKSINAALLEKERHLDHMTVMEARGVLDARVTARVRSQLEELRKRADAAFTLAFEQAGPDPSLAPPPRDRTAA